MGERSVMRRLAINRGWRGVFSRLARAEQYVIAPLGRNPELQNEFLAGRRFVWWKNENIRG